MSTDIDVIQCMQFTIKQQGYRILIALFSSQNPFEVIVVPFLPGVFCLKSSTFSLKCPA